ncbi:MAG: hypothetical protein HY565_03155 [Candidatus Kerfeldbacteria bacterium]|nr:hypothetical protein [Candidatus Kerfeldbacteria bacterium]
MPRPERRQPTRKVVNPEQDPAYQQLRERQHAEHERAGHTQKWFMADVIRDKQRHDAGDDSITEQQLAEAVHEKLQYLSQVDQMDPMLHDATDQLFRASAFRLLHAVDSLDPHSRQHLVELGAIKSTGELNPQYTFEDLADCLMAGNLPYQLYLDIFRLRLENMTEHLAERQAALEQHKADFLNELPGVIEALRLPLDPVLARERLAQVTMRVIDPFTNPSTSVVHKGSGYYDPNQNTVSISYELFDHGSNIVKHAVTHEFYHLLSGQTFLIDTGSNPRVTTQRVGLTVLHQKLLPHRFQWLNEAVTETNATAHLRQVGANDDSIVAYPDEQQILDSLLHMANAPADFQEQLLAAYYANVTAPDADNDRLKPWRTFLGTVRELLGDGMFVHLDKLMQAKNYAAADHLIHTPDAKAVRVAHRVAMEHLLTDTARLDLRQAGNDCLAMLSGHTPVAIETLAHGIRGAIELSMDVAGDYQVLPEQYRSLVEQIVRKTYSDEQNAVLENTCVALLDQLNTTDPVDVATLIQLAYIGDALKETQIRRELSDYLVDLRSAVANLPEKDLATLRRRADNLFPQHLLNLLIPAER